MVQAISLLTNKDRYLTTLHAFGFCLHIRSFKQYFNSIIHTAVTQLECYLIRDLTVSKSLN